VFPQVAYAIGRNCGGAVIRNSLRRRARAVVQSTAAALPRGCFLVRLEPGAAALTPSVFRADVSAALLKAGRERVPA
jgi:ribonuclease P protein component